MTTKVCDEMRYFYATKQRSVRQNFGVVWYCVGVVLLISDLLTEPYMYNSAR